jgi:trimethylamine--corrinoid protein Co-methyltransferase
MLAGAKTIYGMGMVELGMSFSLEQLIIDNDYIKMAEYLVKGIEVTPETLSVDSILQVGAGNNFIAHKTTRENMNIQSNPKYINREMIGDWQAKGSKDIVTAAHETVKDVLKNYEVYPIDKDIGKDIWAIVEKADKDYAAGRLGE